MRLSRLSGIVAILLFVFINNTLAESVVVEGAASIQNGNLPAAREEAIRNALAEATRRASLNVSATIGSTGNIALDQVVVKAAANVQRHQIISERHDEQLYWVTISADMESDQGRQEDNACRDGHTKRLLIGGFPMLRPEQLLMGELTGYAHLTGREIAGRFSAQPAVFVDHNGSIMLHYGVPERVIGDMPVDSQAWTIGRAKAVQHRAQYLLVGRYRSLALSPDQHQREIDIEALIIDAFSGSCVARMQFHETASGGVVPPSSISFGSTAHYATDLGRAHSKLLTQIARWAEATTSCLPFSARVLKVEGKSIYFDAGAEQAIAIGNSFSAYKALRKPITTSGGEILGIEKKVIGDIKVTSVYPRFSIGELTSPSSSNTPEPGDELHSR
ncbi:flagellar assembly protein T N-terminal domain-containing protein [Propionivibrio sp.]|uniref:flagellar assembly protein T N-terminal domain-containing protein n=1 Tax=Propionivibrio sp. TaxID=2212460 RepID=UPI003BF3321F